MIPPQIPHEFGLDLKFLQNRIFSRVSVDLNFREEYLSFD
jgi:hypothetical protein